MTGGPLEFTLARNADPASDEVRADILRDPGFGRFHTDHMVSIDYTAGQGHPSPVCAFMMKVVNGGYEAPNGLKPTCLPESFSAVGA